MRLLEVVRVTEWAIATERVSTLEIETPKMHHRDDLHIPAVHSVAACRIVRHQRV
jgi:hypothetical protein